MATQLYYCKDDAELLPLLEEYAKANGLPDVQSVIRLAYREQLKRKPPKKIPDGVIRKAGNPRPETGGKAGAAARWGTPVKQRRRKAADAVKSSGR